MQMTSIKIDLDVYKVIEARRLSFDESPNDILRRDYGISDQGSPRFHGKEPLPVGRPKLARRSGLYAAKWRNGEVTATSLKGLLKEVLLELARSRPTVIEELSRHRTSRGRRIVAKKPEELYPGRLHLVEHGAERLDTHWWYDTNISRGQCDRYLGVVGAISGVGKIVIEKQS